jgi:hypothetical protein
VRRDKSRRGRLESVRYAANPDRQDAIADAVADLGRPEEIGFIFAGFQKYFYEQGAASG